MVYMVYAYRYVRSTGTDSFVVFDFFLIFFSFFFHFFILFFTGYCICTAVLYCCVPGTSFSFQLSKSVECGEWRVESGENLKPYFNLN